MVKTATFEALLESLVEEGDEFVLPWKARPTGSRTVMRHKRQQNHTGIS